MAKLLDSKMYNGFILNVEECDNPAIELTIELIDTRSWRDAIASIYPGGKWSFLYSVDEENMKAPDNVEMGWDQMKSIGFDKLALDSFAGAITYWSEAAESKSRMIKVLDDAIARSTERMGKTLAAFAAYIEEIQNHPTDEE